MDADAGVRQSCWQWGGPFALSLYCVSCISPFTFSWLNDAVLRQLRLLPWRWDTVNHQEYFPSGPTCDIPWPLWSTGETPVGQVCMFLSLLALIFQMGLMISETFQGPFGTHLKHEDTSVWGEQNKIKSCCTSLAHTAPCFRVTVTAHTWFGAPDFDGRSRCSAASSLL